MSQTKRRWSTGHEVNQTKSGRLTQPQPEPAPAPLPTDTDLLAAAAEYRAALVALGQAEKAEDWAHCARAAAEERVKLAEEELIAVSLRLNAAGTPHQVENSPT